MSLHEFLGLEKNEPTKVCVYCEQEKSLLEFPKHSHHLDGLDTRCRTCIKQRSSIVKRLKEYAPPMPSVCDCCGKKPNIGSNLDPSRRKRGLSLDHDPITNEFRGWLCDSCNTGIGKLGDSIEGLERAKKYLTRNKENEPI